MAGSTDHYGLSVMGPGDTFAANGYQHVGSDRHRIDRLLNLGVEHVHTGSAFSLDNPLVAPSLTLSLTGGVIPSGIRVYYKYTYVNERGDETLPSPESFVDTPAAIGEPGAPTVSNASTGGTLPGGNYYYALSAYVNTNTAETRALNFAFLTVPLLVQTNEATLVLPSLPSGATGFNVYRRAPGQVKYFFLDSVNMSVATPPSVYVDDGTTSPDCDRSLPLSNATNSTNSVEICHPGATPTVPDGYTWKIYRTYASTDYNNSTLHHVVEYTSEATPIITPCFTDVGAGTTGGSPPTVTGGNGTNPSKINLTDSAEVQGSLPLGLTAFPFEIVFFFGGALEVISGTSVWICEFPVAEIVACRAALGRGFSPSSVDVIADINKGDDSLNPTYTTIFSTQATRPKVVVGNQIGSRTTPQVTLLERGESLTVDIDQIGGGATPNDQDLSVTVSLIVYGYPGISYIEGSSGGEGGGY